MNISFDVNNEFIDKIRKAYGQDCPVEDLVREALMLLSLGISETAQGRMLVTVDEKGENARRFATPLLTTVTRPRA